MFYVHACENKVFWADPTRKFHKMSVHLFSVCFRFLRMCELACSGLSPRVFNSRSYLRTESYFLNFQATPSALQTTYLPHRKPTKEMDFLCLR